MAGQEGSPARPVGVAFPGQGVDPVAACAVLDAHRGHHLVDALAGLVTENPIEPRHLVDTRVAQPVVVAAGLLAVESAGLTADESVGVVAGHSLGEITALAFAGVMSATDALALVARRAELGHRAHQERPGRMVAVLKLEREVVEQCRRDAAAQVGGEIGMAVVNGPRQMVLSGDRATVDRAADLVAEAGGLPRRLGIGGAFHSPLLADHVPELVEAAAAVCVAPARVPVAFSTADVVVAAGGYEGVEHLVGEALVAPVDWVRTMGNLAARVDRVIDAGPGRTLVNLAAHTPVVETVALYDR